MQINISLVRLRHTIGEMSRISKALKVRAKEIEQVSIELGTVEDGAMRTIARNLKIENENLSTMIRRMDIMRLSLERILNIYIQTEMRLEDSSEGFQIKIGEVSVISAENLISNNAITGKFIALN